MIRTLLFLPFLVFLAGLAVWAAALFGSAGPEDLVLSLTQMLAGAYSSEAHPDALLTDALHWATPATVKLGHLLGLPHSPTLEALVITRVHTAVALDLLPFLGALLLAGLFTGAALRERLRLGVGYASPSACTLSRLLFGIGILAISLFAFTPAPLPFVTVYAGGIVSSFSGCLYVANLPLRL